MKKLQKVEKSKLGKLSHFVGRTSLCLKTPKSLIAHSTQGTYDIHSTHIQYDIGNIYDNNRFNGNGANYKNEV